VFFANTETTDKTIHAIV